MDEETIIVPEGVNEIEENQFEERKNLKEIKLPTGLKSIGKEAFVNYSSLAETIEVPDDVTEIKPFAFSNRGYLKEIKLPKNVKSIGFSAFSDCGSLETIEIPDGVTEIKKMTFYYCRNLKKIILPKSLKSIGEYAFFNCDSLETIEIPDGVTEIKDNAFGICLKLKKIILPKSLKSIGKEAFRTCFSLETIEIPDGVTEIKEKTFYYCEKLKKAILPDSITKIGSEAFSECESLKKINLPNSLQSIDYEAFYNCESLEEINIPDSVTNIGTSYQNAFSYLNNIGSCFKRCTKLKQVKLSKNIENLPKNCFENCTSLEKVILPTKLETIEECAFGKCTSLKSIVIPNGVNTIKNGAFSDCESLKEIVIPTSLIEISIGAFEGYALKKIIINYESIENLGRFIYDNQRFFEENPHISVTFAGPKLSFIEKTQIILNFKRKVSFIEGQVPITMSEYTPTAMTNLDEDIKKIIDEINETCSKLPEKNKEEITRQVTELLDDYNSDKEKYKPKIFEHKETITLKTGSSNMLKPNLLANLNMIKLNLASEKKLIKFLSDLEKYKKLLTEDINELSNSNSIEEIIKNIIYYFKFIDEDKKNEYLTKLKEYIDIEIKKSNNKIVSINKKEIKLDTKYEQDYEEEFRLNVLKLYDDISAYASKIIPYKNLLDTLTTKEEISKPNLDNNTLTGLINGIKYIIVNLSDSKHHNKLEDKFKEFINKYSKKIEESLKEPNDLNQTKYENLEHRIREELQPLLEQIRNYAYLDEYESANINSANTLNQLYSCKDIIEGKKQVKPTKKQNEEVLTSTIIYINNKSLELLKSPNLDNENRERIETELLRVLKIINTNIEELEAKPLGNIEEYYSKLRKILGEFMDTKLGIELYIKENDDSILKK